VRDLAKKNQMQEARIQELEGMDAHVSLANHGGDSSQTRHGLGHLQHVSKSWRAVLQTNKIPP